MTKDTIDKTLDKWQEKVKEAVDLPETVTGVLDQAIAMISTNDEDASKFQERVEALIPNLPPEDRKRMTRFLLDFNYVQGLCRLDENVDCKQGTTILTERVKEFKGEVETSPSLMVLLNRKVETPS